MSQLTLSILEISVLMGGAILVGVTIHFVISSRRSFKAGITDGDKTARELSDWKLRYFNDIEKRDKEISQLKRKIESATDSSTDYSSEIDELKRQNKRLQTELDSLKQLQGSSDKPDYIQHLREAQLNLMEQNDKISQLLDQIDIVKDNEEKQQEIQKYNQELSGQVEDLRNMLSQKEKEVDTIRQKAHLTREMSSMLDNAYNEFNVLQDKMQKLEAQVNSSRRINLEYEDLKEGHFKISRDFDEQKQKLMVMTSENQHLQAELDETEEKLREANFQRQQLQKRVAYLEELNNDMQAMSEANKKLETQLKRIGELESMLNVVAEERDELARKAAN